MSGLSQVGSKKVSSLPKEAGEGSKEHNVKQLIIDEAYNQLSQKIPKWMPFLVGISVYEVNDDGSAIGGAVVSTGAARIIIPVVYTNGAVDATTFVYSEDNDTILALTKNIIKFLSPTDAGIAGSAYTPGSDSAGFDAGNINKIFIPPKTYNPKIASASGALLFSVLEKSANVRSSFAESFSDDATKSEFDRIYGDGASEYIVGLNNELSKTASVKDDAPAIMISSLDKLANSSWDEKAQAYKEMGENGFVISHGYHTQRRRLEKAASVGTALKEKTGRDALESVSLSTPGTYELYSSVDLSPFIVTVVSGLWGNSVDILGTCSEPERDDPFVGRRVDSDKFTSTLHSFGDSAYDGSARVIVMKDGEVFGARFIGSLASCSKKGLSTTTIVSGDNKIVISKNSDASPIQVGGTIYVGDKNVLIDKRDKSSSVETTPVKMSELFAPYSPNKSEIIKVAHDGATYYMENKGFSRDELVTTLMDDGFDKHSIYSLIKTAKESGSAEYLAINAKLDMLATVVTNLAGQVAAQQQSMAGLGAIQQPVAPQEVEQAAPAQQEAAVPQGSDALDVPQQQGAIDPMAGPIDPAMAPMEDPAGQPPPQEEGLVDGMNPGLDPAVMDMLSQIKDSNVMDVSVIAMLAGGESLSDILRDYSGDLLTGASAVGRILINLMTKKNSVISELGENKAKKIEKMLRTVFTKMTEVYVDIAKIEIESDGKVGS